MAVRNQHARQSTNNVFSDVNGKRIGLFCGPGFVYKHQLYSALRKIKAGKLIIDLEGYQGFEVNEDNSIKPIIKRFN